MRTNIVRAVYRSTVATETKPAFQYDVGLKLVFDGIDLPDAYQVHFGNDQRGDAYVCIGNSEGVQIPDALLRTGLPVYAWVWLQTGQDDGETVYTAIIPVIKRAKPVETQPTPVQRDTITEAIAALNAGVQTVEGIAEAMPGEIEDALAEAKASGEFDGPQGPQGEKGDKGDTGDQGPKGDTGATGPQGAKGDKGDTGEQGPKGETGAKGDTGATGPQGEKGEKGDTGPAGQDGAPGVDGQDGQDGAPGTAGPGVASGGTTGQMLVKKSNTDYDTDWANVPSVPVQDVQVNGTSVLNDGIANVPVASSSAPGVVMVDQSYGIIIHPTLGYLAVNQATDNDIKAGTVGQKPIVPYTQHASAFYGLAKAAGDSTQSASDNAVGTYTESAKSAISQMLNAPVTVSGTTPTITAKAGIQYVCGEVSTLTIVVPESGCIDVIFESGSTPTVLTVTPPTGKTMKWPGWFDPDNLETNATYEINILNGTLGAVSVWI